MTSSNLQSTPTNQFRLLARKGYKARLISVLPSRAKLAPLHLNAKGKLVGLTDKALGKAPAIRHDDGRWTGRGGWFDHVTTDDDLNAWFQWGANVGVRTGNGLVAIDADVKDQALASQVEAIIEAIFGPLPKRVGLPPKALFLIRVEEDVPYSRVEFGARDSKDRLVEAVELLTTGRQFVAHGWHPSGRLYEWRKPMPDYEDIPGAGLDQVERLMHRLETELPSASRLKLIGGEAVAPELLAGPPEAVCAALDAIPNNTNRNDWIAMAHALAGALPHDLDLAKQLFLEFSERWTGDVEDDSEAEREFDKIKPERGLRIGAEYVFQKAEAARRDGTALNGFNLSKLHLLPFDGELDVSGYDEAELDAKLAVPGARDKYKLFWADECHDLALRLPPRALVKNVLSSDSLAVMYGGSGIGKTFLALSLGRAIATGAPWAGNRVQRGAVVHIIAEGGAANAHNRVRALNLSLGNDGSGAAHAVLPARVNLFRPDADLKPLAHMLETQLKQRGERLALLIVDTMAAAMAGGDENTTQDIERLFENLGTLRRKLGCAVLFIHHIGKNPGRGARGAYAIKGGVDTEIRVEAGRLVVDKLRDARGKWYCDFALETIETGALFEDGEAVTSNVVRLLGTGFEETAPAASEASPAVVFERIYEQAGVIALLCGESLAPMEQRVFAAVRELCSDLDLDTGLQEVNIAEYLKKVGKGTTSKSVHTRLYALKRMKLVEKLESGWRPAVGTILSTVSFTNILE